MVTKQPNVPLMTYSERLPRWAKAWCNVVNHQAQLRPVRFEGHRAYLVPEED